MNIQLTIVVTSIKFSLRPSFEPWCIMQSAYYVQGNCSAFCLVYFSLKQNRSASRLTLTCLLNQWKWPDTRYKKLLDHSALLNLVVNLLYTYQRRILLSRNVDNICPGYIVPAMWPKDLERSTLIITNKSVTSHYPFYNKLIKTAYEN